MKYITVWLLATNIVLAYLLYLNFGSSPTFKELTAKRINIVGEDDLPRLVLSNESRQHSGRIEGKNIPDRKRPAGIIFFNNEGNESGGIISAASSGDGRISSGMSFTMDRYNNDQVIQILNHEIYENDEEKVQRGLLISEFPKGAKFFEMDKTYKSILKIKNEELRKQELVKLVAEQGAKKRAYLGKNMDDETGLVLYSKKGTPVLKFVVDKEDNPKLVYLRSDGKMVDLLSSKN